GLRILRNFAECGIF
ncbi:MAG TPA: hypothetical protein PK867_26175, partial [Pirellulales bacterium]|nr:hypothetical protein [Pirellulales bacterium]